MTDRLKKFIVFALAAALCAFCVGGALALYISDAAPRTVTLRAWQPDANTYYVVGTMNNWAPTNTSSTLTVGGTDGVIAHFEGIKFNAGDEFKIKKGTSWYNLKSSAAVTGGDATIGTGTSLNNAVINTTGYYNIEVKSDGFYLKPGVDPDWDGTLTIDAKAVGFIEDAGAKIYLHVWYDTGPNNGWPGVEVTKTATARVYTAPTDTSRTISGVILSRWNPNGGSDPWNQTGNITYIPVSHIVKVTSM